MKAQRTVRDSLSIRSRTIRKEYLMDEGNRNFTDEFVDYLGIWSKDKAENKLAMRIDTAWLNRVGNVKPQYLISL